MSVSEFETALAKQGWRVNESQSYKIDGGRMNNIGFTKDFTYEQGGQQITVPFSVDFPYGENISMYQGFRSLDPEYDIDKNKLTFDVTVQAHEQGLTNIDYDRLRVAELSANRDVERAQDVALEFDIKDRLGPDICDAVKEAGWDIKIDPGHDENSVFTGPNEFVAFFKTNSPNNTEHAICSQSFVFTCTPENFVFDASNMLNNTLISDVQKWHGQDAGRDGILGKCNALLDKMSDLREQYADLDPSKQRITVEPEHDITGHCYLSNDLLDKLADNGWSVEAFDMPGDGLKSNFRLSRTIVDGRDNEKDYQCTKNFTCYPTDLDFCRALSDTLERDGVESCPDNDSIRDTRIVKADPKEYADLQEIADDVKDTLEESDGFRNIDDLRAALDETKHSNVTKDVRIEKSSVGPEL